MASCNIESLGLIISLTLFGFDCFDLILQMSPNLYANQGQNLQDTFRTLSSIAVPPFHFEQRDFLYIWSTQKINLLTFHHDLTD